MKFSFGKITELPRGTLRGMLLDAYSFDRRCFDSWSDDWRDFDDFFFDNPSIAERYGFITMLDGAAAGFISWDPRPHLEYVETGHNCIVTKFKGLGYGIIQLQEAVRRILETSPPKIIVTTSGNFIPAQRMYERVGFQQVCRRANDHFSGELIDYEYCNFKSGDVAT